MRTVIPVKITRRERPFIKFMFRSLICSLVVASGVPTPASAYIPRSHTIFARTAKNGGKGFYAIEQEVQFRSMAEPVTLRERWIVENGENMRLYVMSPKSSKDVYKYDVLYRDGKKTFPDLAGSIQSIPNGLEFIECFEHFRSGRGLMDALIRAKVLPPAILHSAVHITNVASIKHQPEAYVRLGRSGGVVSWIFGEPTPIEGTRLFPEVWISQDSFTLEKIRFPSQAEMTAEKFSSSGPLHLPRERTISWNNNSVVIRVTSMRPITANANIGKILAPASMSLNELRADRLPDQPAIREFYSRFR